MNWNLTGKFCHNPKVYFQTYGSADKKEDDELEPEDGFFVSTWLLGMWENAEHPFRVCKFSHKEGWMVGPNDEKVDPPKMWAEIEIPTIWVMTTDGHMRTVNDLVELDMTYEHLETRANGGKRR